MNYSTLDHVQTEQGDDIHLRFGFDVEVAKLVFSIIVYIVNKPEPREFKANSIEEIFAWLRFNRLSTALLNSPKFCKKYTVVKTDVSESMIVLTINKLPTFYVKSETGEWDCNSDIAIFAQKGTTNFENAKSILGKDFMSRYEKREKELAQIAQNQLALKSEMKTGDKNDVNIKDNQQALKIVDIENSISAVF